MKENNGYIRTLQKEEKDYNRTHNKPKQITLHNTVDKKISTYEITSLITCLSGHFQDVKNLLSILL